MRVVVENFEKGKPAYAEVTFDDLPRHTVEFLAVRNRDARAWLRSHPEKPPRRTVP